MRSKQIARFARAVLAGALSAGAGGTALAANQPLGLTAGSFNADVILENSATATATRAFGSNRAYAEDGYTGANAITVTPGLPVAADNSTVDFTSATGSGTVFRLQAYESNNALFLPNAATPIVGTMTLTTPAAYGSLSVLATASDTSSGTNAPTVTMTLNFATGSPVTTTFTMNDWNGNAGSSSGVPVSERAIGGLDRVNITGGSALTTINVENANSYTLAERVFDLTNIAGQDVSGRNLVSVDFSQSRTGTASTSFSTPAVAVFGLSAGPAVPEPAGVGLVAAGALAGLIRRRR